MNSSSPPPIDPNLLDARVKPLVPRKAKGSPSPEDGTKASTASVPQQQLQTKKPKVYHNTATRLNPSLSTSAKHKSSSAETTKTKENTPPESPDEQKRPNLGGQKKPNNDVGQESKSRFGLAFVIILAVACIGVVGYSIGRASVEQDYRDRLANASQSISNLTNELASTTTALADTKQQLEIQGREWAEYRVSTSNTINELRARLRQEEDSDPFRLQTSFDSPSSRSSVESDASPTLIVKASIPGQTSVSATMDWNGRTARLPVRIRNLEFGQYLWSRKVSASFGGSEYDGVMPDMTVNWRGEKTITVELARTTFSLSDGSSDSRDANKRDRQEKQTKRELSKDEKRIKREVRDDLRRVGVKVEDPEDSFWSHLWPF